MSPVMVVDEDGINLGIMPTREALNLAYDKGLDLVEINPTNRPPVCKIMDFGKYKYEISKKERDSRGKQRESELKEIRLTFKIGEHDLDYKAKQAREFFDHGNKVKVSMRLRGRENIMGELALAVFQKFAQKTDLKYERPPVRAGNQIVGMLTEKKPGDIEKKQEYNEITNAQSNSKKS